ncbi:MAG: hypothetical protein KME13_26150 [Myxacorys californica WJT36-NPBG1]|jgi:hypothetical protein|nr:hypothetical protein [Myxacorys californica WJT36-NPBG1]
MNSIAATTHQTKFTAQPHLVIAIDGTPLDAILTAAFSHQQFNGLVPTILGQLDDDRERQIVWQRILPIEEERSIAPILMCPNDRDFWCVIVLADILATPQTIHWQRLGIDQSLPVDLPEQIGKKVEWLDGIGPFAFDRGMYTQMLDVFRCSIELDDAL